VTAFDSSSEFQLLTTNATWGSGNTMRSHLDPSFKAPIFASCTRTYVNSTNTMTCRPTVCCAARGAGGACQDAEGGSAAAEGAHVSAAVRGARGAAPGKAACGSGRWSGARAGQHPADGLGGDAVLGRCCGDRCSVVRHSSKPRRQ
jgi:hypothetical protein